jgi:hypothetical protein
MADDEQKSAEIEQNKEVVVEDKKKVEEEKISPLDEARKFNEDSKKVLAEMKSERLKIEKAAAEMLVNGKSLAGQVIKAETADEKWAREAKERYKGTGLDPT